MNDECAKRILWIGHYELGINGNEWEMMNWESAMLIRYLASRNQKMGIGVRIDALEIRNQKKWIRNHDRNLWIIDYELEEMNDECSIRNHEKGMTNDSINHELGIGNHENAWGNDVRN